eukprot:5813825-Pleurochrysis_carterae.AAC.1
MAALFEPKLLPSTALRLDGLRVSLPASLAAAATAALGGGNDALTGAGGGGGGGGTLASRRAAAAAATAAASLRLVGYRLLLGVHSGDKLLAEPKAVALQADSRSSAAVGGDGGELLLLRPQLASVECDGFVLQPSFGLVAELQAEYEVDGAQRRQVR